MKFRWNILLYPYSLCLGIFIKISRMRRIPLSRNRILIPIFKHDFTCTGSQFIRVTREREREEREELRRFAKTKRNETVGNGNSRRERGERGGGRTSLLLRLWRLASLEKGTTSRGREDPKLSARRSSGAEPIAPGNVNGKTPGILAEVRQGQLVAGTRRRSQLLHVLHRYRPRRWKRPSICDSFRAP